MITKVFDFMQFPRRPIQALVIRKNHAKTVMCEVTRRILNRHKYGGVVSHRKNYMVHDPYDQCHIGDVVRIKHSDILKPFEASVFTAQNPEYLISRAARKDRKRQDKAFELSLQDPVTQTRLSLERDEKEKEKVVEALLKVGLERAVRKVVVASGREVDADTTLVAGETNIPHGPDSSSSSSSKK